MTLTAGGSCRLDALSNGPQDPGILIAALHSELPGDGGGGGEIAESGV